jgi:ornithine decarboxylase
VDSVRGLIYPEEDAPDFVGKYVNPHFEAYAEQLKTPFFGRIIDFNESSNERRVQGPPAVVRWCEAASILQE